MAELVYLDIGRAPYEPTVRLQRRLLEEVKAAQEELAYLVFVEHDPPVDKLDADFPIRLTTGRRLDSYNTGVQTAGYTSPLRRGRLRSGKRNSSRTRCGVACRCAARRFAKGAGLLKTRMTAS